MSPSSSRWLWPVAFIVSAWTTVAQADDPFSQQVVPFLAKYCVKCHNADQAEAELNLARFNSAESAAGEFRQWEHVVTFLEREEMPPKSAEQPSPELRTEMLKTLRTVLAAEARKQAGDPGVVLPRRLSNAEYDYTIRDLTGVDIHPTKSFPVDPAAGEGFSNTGEALTMSPSLFAKLYAAAQYVADHALLTTTGLDFAPYRVATFADRNKFYEQAILQFYEQHQIDYETYLSACWEYRHRPAGWQEATIEDWARERRLSPKYLRTLYELLQSDIADAYFIDWLRQRWNELPSPADSETPALTATTHESVRQLAREIRALSVTLCPREGEAIIAHAGNGPIDHLARRRKTAAQRDAFNPDSIAPNRRLWTEFKAVGPESVVRIVLAATSVGTKSEPGYVVLKSLNFSTAPQDQYQPNDEKRNFPLRKVLAEHAPGQVDRLKFGVHPAGGNVDADSCVLTANETIELEVPAAAFNGVKEVRFFIDADLDRQHTKSGRVMIALNDPKGPPLVLADPDHPGTAEIAASGARFCRVFPNRFYFVDDTRGLSAGFHLIEGFFRDDQPLCQRVLSDDENRELNRLWTELEFVTGITEKMLRGFVFFERSERNFLKHPDFDSFREEDPKLVEAETLNRFERVYLDRSNVTEPIEQLADHPIHVFFEQIRNGLALDRKHSHAAMPTYLADLERFARRAYRRPLSASELEDLRADFRRVAGEEKNGLDQAVRASIVRILMSPYFCCRIDPSPAGDSVEPLPDLALASRLSYFLWSSMPDDELLQLAEAGRLHDEEVLLAQMRRMLQDDKVADFAREFFGQWLGYRDFPQQESVDRTVFPDFDEPLKEAMFEEPTRFAAHLIRTDAPLTTLLEADATFVNQRLASHYGLPFSGGADEWQLTTGLRQQGRGGILGMAVFLTRHSQPQRTSPVKRGFWVVHKLLGEHIPAPPADVVALPAKETDTNGKTIRELLALHVADAKCARCHQRFDAVGLAMERFDPIGRLRDKDLAGRPIDDVVKLSDGSEARGVPDFSRHLAQSRRNDLSRTFCRKLLGYALGRSLLLSDDVLLNEMQLALDNHEGRIVPLFETIVLSPQFRNQRSRDFSMARFRSLNQKDER